MGHHNIMHIVIIPAANFAPEKGRGIFELQQAKALQKHGHKVSIICAGYHAFTDLLNPTQPDFHSQDDGIAIYQKYKRPLIPLRFVNKYGYYNQRKAFSHLAEACFLKYGKADIIHAHNSLFAGHSARYLSQKYNLPFVITEHDSSHARNLLSHQTRQMSRLAMLEASKVIAVSHFQKKHLTDLLGDNENLTVIANMIDPLMSQPHSNMLTKQADDHLSFITIGSLDNNKNHALLLQGFADYCTKRQNCSLTIIGDGADRPSLEALTHQLGIANKVSFTGHLDRVALKDYLIKSDIYLHTSTIETFGVSMIEAMSLGKIVITTKSGGPNDFITNDNGIFIEDFTPAAVSGAISYVVDNLGHYDPQKIAKVIKNKYSASEIAKQLILVYDWVLTNHDF